MTKQEYKKYRKEVIKEIDYNNIYEDGLIETKQGTFVGLFETSVEHVFDNVLPAFDVIYNLYDSVDDAHMIRPGQELKSQILYYKGHYYVALSITANSYEEARTFFEGVDKLNLLSKVSLRDYLMLLYELYQNEDGGFEERYIKSTTTKKDMNPVNFQAEMKNLKRNKQCSKDLILPLYFKVHPEEMEFEGNYLRLFYLKNLPQYLSEEFINNLMAIDDICFSFHIKPLHQLEIVEYTEMKFKTLQDLKSSQALQKEFFEFANPELRKSARRDEEMFLVTLVLGVPHDSLDVLDELFKNLIREMESTYVLKELKYQQKTAFKTLLPFCQEKLDIQTTIYKKKEEKVMSMVGEELNNIAQDDNGGKENA